MNNSRRKELEKAVNLLEEAQSILEDCREEEQEYLDNMPENLQYSEKHDMAEEAVTALEGACESVLEAIDSVNEATA